MKKNVNQSARSYVNKRAPYVSPEVQGIRRFKPGTFVKVMSILLLIVSLVLIGIVALQRKGYHLIHIAATYYLLALAVAGVLAVAIYGARKLVKRPGLKKTMTISATIMALIILVYVFSFASSSSYIISEAGRATSPEGTHKLVILRAISFDEQEARDAVLADNPDYTEEQLGQAVNERMQAGDQTGLYYLYFAYPIKYGIFYSTNVQLKQDGLMIVSADSEGELRVRWDDEDTATLYLANPGPKDSGEFTVILK